MKTLFFSISSTPVFRNFLFFPGSVCQRFPALLEKEKDLRIVLLFPRRDYEKYFTFFSPLLGERCVAEIVDAPSPKGTIIQKIFYFFYSYLIYTGTTKIMATWGMRPEEPPAGGRWYLAPLKCGIALTVGRIRAVKTKLVPFLYYRLYRDRPFADIFEKYKPTCVFVPHLYGQFDTRLRAEAACQGVRTIGMAAGWDHLDKYFLPFQTDILLAQNEQMKRAAIHYQAYRADHIEIVGYPHLDLFFQSRARAMPRQELLRRLNFSENAEYILYISGSAYCPDEPEIIQTMLSWADEGKFGRDVRMVIRPYLGGRGKDREFDEKKFNSFEAHKRVSFYRRDFWADLEKVKEFINIMRHASAVICVYSTAFLEAAVLDRPLVALAFDGSRVRPLKRSIRRFLEFEHFQDVFRTGAVQIAYSFNDLFSILARYFKNPSYDHEARARLIRDVCYRFDGATSERVLEVLVRTLKKS